MVVIFITIKIGFRITAFVLLDVDAYVVLTSAIKPAHRRHVGASGHSFLAFDAFDAFTFLFECRFRISASSCIIFCI